MNNTSFSEINLLKAQSQVQNKTLVEITSEEWHQSLVLFLARGIFLKGVMEPSDSCLPRFFMASLLLQITVLTQAMNSDIQINILVPDTEGVLVECTSGRLIPPAEMTWRDSKGNVIPHSTTFDSQDKAGLLYLKSSILLKNRAQGPISCSIYNGTTNQEKKRSIVLPDVLFKPEYMSLMSSKFSCPLIYLIIILFLNCLRGIFVFYCLKGKPVHFRELMNEVREVLNCKMGPCCMLIWEFLLLVLYTVFLPLYLNFRSRASILDDAYPLYSNWLSDICIILSIMMIFFTVLILFLLWTLNRYSQMSYLLSTSMDLSRHDSEQNSSKSSEFHENYDMICKMLLGTREEMILSQHQESCEEDSFNPLQPLRLDCSLN
ncbi:selection and upkeep of intraepithelial T-cells protein 10-like [Mastomys coucha]|uniref:selection and upkeep of intraepithelial T-cells protein 10-like n=1 Tax=Mastomys coucha TaxID=35658 RepID=UPI0012617691|nr:selection and upkeep of intraepithelial T-cells protein 10-like [Mastomys coucha]XP_031234081.1 selection and upkeep of intraepithelial T-cells protein 10-like [Mastomys coucha]XP_031234082.1 selection and upkeep of intraepithelial T-cells protein 10-like [Mastomys coucha]XP_031234083.1 selection and upkeep of intraepithelial T-cells protein 10-like [Mastomys coucha]